MKVEDHQKEHTHQLVAAPRWAWLYLIFGFIFLMGGVFWLFFGKIPITVSGKGIILTDVGLFSVQSRASGTVINKKIKPGDKVKKGDLLMTIYDPQLELKVQKSNSMTSVLESQLKDLKQEVGSEEKIYKDALRVKISAIRFNISQLQESIAFATKELEERKKLVDEGLISPLKYNEALQNIARENIEMQTKISDLALADAEVKKEYRADEIKLKELQLRNEMENQKILAVSLEQGKIYSPHDGIILEVLVNTGDLIQTGAPLVWMEKDTPLKSGSENYIIFGYFQVEKGKKIRPGNEVKMSVSGVNSNQYGSIIGKVKEVSLYAVSQEQLLSKIHNKSLIEYLTNQSAAVVQATIIPQKDSHDPQLLQWTSGKQPPIPLSAGTIGVVEARVEQVRPIYYLIPIPSFKYNLQTNQQDLP